MKACADLSENTEGWQHDGVLLSYDTASHGNYGYQDVGASTPVSRGHRQTRSGNINKPTDSPMSSARSTPAATTRFAGVRKNRAKKAPEADITLQAPLSVLTKDFETPLRDMEAWANRSAEERRKEAEKAGWKIARPMNRFMMYRSAYAERTKKWCDQNNHQIVSKVTGQSWKKLEPKEIKDYYDRLATIERENHQRAFPDYKFAPAKATPKKKNPKRILDYPEDTFSDTDGEWAPSGQQSRQAAKQPPRNAHTTSNPYADNHYPYADAKAWQFPDPGRYSAASYQQSMPYAVSQAQMYHAQAYPYPVASGQYTSYHQVPSQQMHDSRMAMNVTPASVGSSGALVSLPGGQHHELLQSRGPTPVQGYQQAQQGGNLADQSGLLRPDHNVYHLEDEFSGFNSNFQDAMNGGFDMSGGQAASEGTVSEALLVDPQLGSMLDNSPYQQYLEQ